MKIINEKTAIPMTVLVFVLTVFLPISQAYYQTKENTKSIEILKLKQDDIAVIKTDIAIIRTKIEEMEKRNGTFR